MKLKGGYLELFGGVGNMAVAAAKALARDLGPRIDTAVVEHTIAALAARWESPEAAEGIGAFFDKRKPGWVR